MEGVRTRKRFPLTKVRASSLMLYTDIKSNYSMASKTAEKKKATLRASEKVNGGNIKAAPPFPKELPLFDKRKPFNSEICMEDLVPFPFNLLIEDSKTRLPLPGQIQ